MEKKKITIDLYVYNDKQVIVKWFWGMLLFEPKHMSFKNYARKKAKKYLKNIFFADLEKEILEDKFQISYNDEKNSVYCMKNYNSEDVVMLFATIDIAIYKKNYQDIITLSSEIINIAGVCGKIQQLDDWVWQNNTDLSEYKYQNRSLEGIPLKQDSAFNNETVVDIEKLPGYEKQIDNIWFGAAWKMWFGEPYYEFVSKEAIEKFKDCYKNEQIADNCRCITLYEDMDDYENPENRARQWKFKEAIDFQNVIKRLAETGINRVNDPELEIEEGIFAHGGIRLFKGYFDNEGNIVPKSKASKMKITEHGGDGSVLWEDEQNIL